MEPTLKNRSRFKNRSGHARALLAAALLCSATLHDPVAGALQAQQQPAVQTTVAGKLVGPDGAAAPGLEVRLIPVPSSYLRRLRELGVADAESIVDRTRSDADGRFELTAPRIGPYRIEVLAAVPDTTPPTVAAPVHAQLLPLAEPTVLAPIQLPETYDFVVGARDEAGKPVEGALVIAQATRRSDRESRRPEPAQFDPGQPWRRPPRAQQPEPIYPTFGRAVARTGADGLVRLSLPTADANVFVAASGFELRADMVEGRGRFEMRRDPGVTLRVLDSGGTPIPRALIRVAENLAVPLALTDESGEATVGLNRGEAIPFQVETEDRSFGRTQPIELPGDDPARPHVVEVRVEPPVELTGRTVDAQTSGGIAGSIVWLRSRPGDHAWTDAGGAFTLRTRPNISALQLSAAAIDYRTRATEVPLERLGRRNDLSVELTPAARIIGTVADSSGSPVAGARLLVDRVDPRQPGASLGGTGTSYQWRSVYGMDHRAISGADGTFRLTGMDRGVSHHIIVEAQGFVRASVDLPGVGRGGAPEPLHIVLSRGRRAWGTVLDTAERAVPGAGITIMPATRNPRGGVSLSSDSFLTAATGPGGVFEFPAISAGSYQLSVDHAEFMGPTPANIDIPTGEGDIEIGIFTLTPGMQIEGFVVGPDRRPVEGAQVSTYHGYANSGPLDGGARAATTDHDGRFRIGGLQDRRLQVAVQADGYARYDLKGVRPGGGELLEIELNRGATLTGRVVDSAGEAIQGSQVMAHNADPDLARGPFTPLNAQTDAEGRFRFDLLHAGSWFAYASGSGGGSSRAESGLIQLDTVDVREIELVVPVSNAQVTGVVTNHMGEPVVNSEVRITTRDETPGGSPSRSGPSWQTSTDPRGRFVSIQLPAGAATIVASHPEYRIVLREITLEPGSNEVSLALEPGLEITGSLRSEGGVAIALGEVVAELEPAPGEDPLSDDRLWLRGALHQPAHAVSDRNGDYRLGGLDSGVYVLRAWAHGYGQSAAARPVRLEGGSATGVDIVLPAEATIEVRIAGAPPSDLHVGVSRGDHDFRDATQEASGVYRIEGLGPGDWTVAAGAFDGRTVQESVNLQPGDDTVVEFRFEEGLYLTGWVTIAGQPPAGGSIQLDGGGTQPRWTDLDRDGRFEVEGVLPGAYTLVIAVSFDVPGPASADRGRAVYLLGGTIYKRRIELRGDQDLRLDLESPAVLTGLVRDTEGRPLAGAFLATATAGIDIAAQSAALSSGLIAGIAATDPEGRFELRSAPGSYDLHVTREGFETLTVAMELESAEYRQGLVFELRPATTEPSN